MNASGEYFNIVTSLAKEGLIDREDARIISVDSCLLKAKGHIWHKSSMEKNVVPYSGTDTDARWGFSRTKGWIFGYKLHLACNTGSLIVPLSADFTTANIPDNKVYQNITIALPAGVTYVAADEGYDDHKLYDSSKHKEFNLVCPVTGYRSANLIGLNSYTSMNPNSGSMHIHAEA